MKRFTVCQPRRWASLVYSTSVFRMKQPLFLNIFLKERVRASFFFFGPFIWGFQSLFFDPADTKPQSTARWRDKSKRLMMRQRGEGGKGKNMVSLVLLIVENSLPQTQTLKMYAIKGYESSCIYTFWPPSGSIMLLMLRLWEEGTRAAKDADSPSYSYISPHPDVSQESLWAQHAFPTNHFFQ